MTAVSNLLSVDVEDWFTSSYELFDFQIPLDEWVPPASVLDNTLRMLDILEEAGVRGTFFVLGLVARHHPRVVKEILARGHEVASHAYSHRLLYNLDESQVREELRRSIGSLEQIGGDKVLGFRAPYFSVTRASLWILDILPEYGIQYDSSIFPFQRGLYGISDWGMEPRRLSSGPWELPISVWRIGPWNLPLGGGGYLRLLPTSYFKFGLRRLNAGGFGAVLYFHPYELDSTDTALPAEVSRRGLKRRLLLWQQVAGRKKMARKIANLLRLGNFRPAREIVAELERSQSSDKNG